MSRGGRGGGGFGRGGGGGPQSGAMQLVSFDLLKDLGSGSLFNVNTALFPEMDVPIPRKPTSNEVQEWKLKKEYLALIKESPFHLTPLPPPPDIERYSDKYKVKVQKRSLKDIETNLDFFPEELQTILDPKRKKKQKARAVDAFGEIQALLDAEAKDDEDENDEDKEKEEEGENEEEYEDEEELIDDNDYAETYFDNGEGDDDDDGDGEDAYS